MGVQKPFTLMDALRASIKCGACRGDGYLWTVPSGFNPFSAGGWATARASRKVRCHQCKGTGRAYDNGTKP